MIDSIYQLEMLGEYSTFNASSSMHILASMAKGGVEISPNGCHGGGCGVCKIKILSGNIETLCMSEKHITKEEEKSGYVLACRTFPMSDITFEFIGKVQCKTNEKKKYGFV